MNAKPPPQDLCSRCGNNVTSSTHLLRRCEDADAYEAQQHQQSRPRGTCRECGLDYRLKADGTIWHHKVLQDAWYGNKPCPGAGEKPKEFQS